MEQPTDKQRKQYLKDCDEYRQPSTEELKELSDKVSILSGMIQRGAPANIICALIEMDCTEREKTLLGAVVLSRYVKSGGLASDTGAIDTRRHPEFL